MNDPRAGRLQGLRVLVTRPAHQATGLSAAITRAGGRPIQFPTLEIVPLQPPAPRGRIPDLIVFTSVNAVTHGAPQIEFDERTRFAAVGRATAAAMRAHRLPDPLVPADASSEGLLAEPGLVWKSGARVLLVRGAGGRDLLQRTLAARGLEVASLEVYRRRPPPYTLEQIRGLEERWLAGELDVVTATSAETLENLHGMLGDLGRQCFARTPLVVVSPRIAATAMALGHASVRRVCEGPSDDDIVAALASLVAVAPER